MKQAVAERRIGASEPQRAARINEIFKDELAVIERIDHIEHAQTIGLSPYNLLQTEIALAISSPMGESL
ncbi:MAG: hypothetical protein ACREAB_17940 [Blastocatellia bacterium]